MTVKEMIKLLEQYQDHELLAVHSVERPSGGKTKVTVQETTRLDKHNYHVVVQVVKIK